MKNGHYLFTGDIHDTARDTWERLNDAPSVSKDGQVTIYTETGSFACYGNDYRGIFTPLVPAPDAAREEPMPQPGQEIVKGQLYKHLEAKGMSYLIPDIEARQQVALLQYGTPLMTFNGRNATNDSYQEKIDATMFDTQIWIEGGRKYGADYLAWLRSIETLYITHKNIEYRKLPQLGVSR